MGILPLKKRVKRDKCSFTTKQRMFGVFAIDEILRYRWTPFVGSRTLCRPGVSYNFSFNRVLKTSCSPATVSPFSVSAPPLLPALWPPPLPPSPFQKTFWGTHRGGFCPCCHCRRQCKIFASCVNFSIFTHFLCFFLTKTVEIRWNWRCKIFSLKIRRCKILDKFHVCKTHYIVG